MEAALQGSGLTLLDSLEDSFYPADQFFDAIYHLNRAGIDRRTSALVQSLADL